MAALRVRGSTAARRGISCFRRGSRTAHPHSLPRQQYEPCRETIQKRLSEQAALDIQIHGEFLDLARFPDAAHKRRAVQYLSEKYAASPPDLVLALGPDALRIAIDNRNALAAGAPITFCCISPNRLATIDKSDDVTGIISDFDVAKTVQLARALQPNARQLVVVSGAAPFDVRSVETARQQLAKLPSQLDTR